MITGQKELPASWKWVKLGDAGTITDGDWILKQHYSSRKEVRLLQVGDIGTGFFVGKSSRYISENTALELGCTLLKENDILISRMPDPIGRACLLPKLRYKSITAVDVSIYRPNPVLLDNTFALHYMCSDDWLFKATSLARGATRQRVSRRNLETIPIPLPPLEEQKRIAGILNKAGEIKKLREEADKKTEELIPAIFHDMVGSRIKKGEELPTGWQCVKLGDICEIARGGSPRPIQKYFTNSEDGVNWVKIGDATASDKYIYTTKEKITKEGANRSRAVHEGDFLLSNSMSYGHPYIMATSGYIHDGWLVLRGYETSLNQDFLYYLLGSSSTYNQFESLSAGSTVKNLNAQLVSNLSITLPPLEEQNEIAKRLNRVEEIKKTNAESDKKIEELKSSLLQRAFRGEL